MVIFAVVMTPLLLGLGYWQLNRAAEKQAIINQQTHGNITENTAITDLMAVNWTPQTTEMWNYKKVEMTGRYDESIYLLLDNRTRQGRVGYEVINLFMTDDGNSVWVNRGWVKAPAYRDQWPLVESVKDEVAMTGTIYFNPDQNFMLGTNPEVNHWPRRVQIVDIKAFESELKTSTYPFIVRLADDSQPGALQTGWHMLNMSPEKHKGYAIQWFSLAAVLVLMTIIAIVKNETKEVEPTYDT